MKHLIYVTCGLLVLLLAGCSSRPADDEIRAEIKALLADHGAGRVFEVENLRRVNGVARGENAYDIDVRYELHFRMDLADVPGELQKESGSIFAAGMGAVSLGMAYGDFKAGEVVQKEERYRFVRTEQGWRIDRPPKG